MENANGIDLFYNQCIIDALTDAIKINIEKAIDKKALSGKNVKKSIDKCVQIVKNTSVEMVNKTADQFDF